MDELARTAPGMCGPWFDVFMSEPERTEMGPRRVLVSEQSERLGDTNGGLAAWCGACTMRE